MDRSSPDEQASSPSLATASFATCVAAGAWVWLAFSCWIFAAWTPAAKLPPSWLTTIAIVSAIVMCWVRFFPAELQRHATWRNLRGPIAFAAAVNWLGFILIRSPEPVAAVPSLLVIGIAEAGVMLLSRRNAAKRDCVRPDTKVCKPSSAISLSEQPIGADRLEQMLAEELSSSDAVECNPDELGEELGEYLTRKLRVGTDEHGTQYIAGELFMEFHGDERVKHAIVGFQPAFTTPPDVEVESENADITVELQNCTPVGMRLQFKLDRSATTPASSVIAFYAVPAAETALQPNPAQLP